MVQLNHFVKQMATYKKFLLLLLLMSLLSACGTSPNGTENKSNNTLNSSEFVNELVQKEIEVYEHVLQSKNIKQINLDQVEKIRKTKQSNALIYFGRSTCLYCRKVIIENEEAIKQSPYKILYVNTDSLTSEEKNKLTDFQVTEVPSFIEISKQLELTKIDTEDFERKIQNE